MPSHDELNAHIEEGSAAHETPATPAWQTVLRQIVLCLDDAGIAYKVVGGTAAALHGVPLLVKDIDLEMDAAGTYRFQAIFHSQAVLPVAWLEGDVYRSYFGRFDFDGVIVEVMGDLQRRKGDDWVSTTAATSHQVDLNGVLVNVPWLEEETLAYLRRGRLERAALCLAKCDASRMQALLNGEQRVGVL